MLLNTTRRLRSAAALLTVSLLAAACSVNSDADSADPTSTNPCGPTSPVSGTTPPDSIDDVWAKVFIDDFNRCDLGDDFSTYSGSPGGNPVGAWDASMVSVDGGMLRLRGTKTDDGWITGGVSNYPVTQRYGRWEVRMRAQNSADLSYHMLLWPKDEQWPPEIDFAESIASERDQISAFIHWKDDDGNQKSHAEVGGDFNHWHTVGVEWLPGLIRYLLDGRVWAEVRSDTMVPDIPMWLGMQVEAGACERRTDWGMAECADDEPRPTTADVEIDWVAVYRPAKSESALRDSGFMERTADAIQITG